MIQDSLLHDQRPTDWKFALRLRKWLPAHHVQYSEWPSLCVCARVCLRGQKLGWRDLTVRDLKEIGVPENGFVELARNRAEWRGRCQTVCERPQQSAFLCLVLVCGRSFDGDLGETFPILPLYVKLSFPFHGMCVD